MDKSWINDRNTFSQVYIEGTESFIKFAKENGNFQEGGLIPCPCNFCNNTMYKSYAEVKQDIHCRGFSKTYTEWVYHGEKLDLSSDSDAENATMDEDNQNNDGLDAMLNDMGDVIGETDGFNKLCRNAERYLYPGCGKSLLSVVTKLLHIKVTNKWSDKSFDMLLGVLKDILPGGHTLPNSYYACKQILGEMGMGYDEIDVCLNDCVLFYKENEDKETCPVCGESRWEKIDPKGRKTPHKVLRHFPLKPRLQRLFMFGKTAADMRWHKDKRDVEEGVMRHPADSPAWQHFDKQYPDFGDDPRNVRLGLATDGFTPWANLGLTYSMWPVMVIPYNLPSYQFMKEEHIMMSLLIPGRRSPGKDLDVFLRPLIDELKELWEVGVETYDAHTGEKFQMRASVLWTISDFPGYGSLSGWSTSGKMACPCCFNQTRSKQIRSKTSFMGHRCFLDSNHPWRKNKKAFNGEVERRPKPEDLTGSEVLQWLDSLLHLFGEPGKHPSNTKKRKRTPEQGNWFKKSIFFELEYWPVLLIRHCLDVMHIEKNICDNVMGTILDIKGKTKDTAKSREDLRDWGIREELHMTIREKDNKAVKPPACYTLSASEKDGFFDFLKAVKFPDAYAANISNAVKDKKLTGLKSHDCHILLQRLIPVGMRGYLNKEINDALYELGDFFKELCSKTLKVDDIDKLEKNIPLTLCKLEKIFPPAFFTVMVHLSVHLPREARLAGPVQPRWMYPIERNLGALKDYVRNRARPEASIAQGYIMKESLKFASMYLTGIETRHNKRTRNYDDAAEPRADCLSVFVARSRPFGLIRRNSGVALSDEELDKAHLFILSNCEEVDKYIKIYKAEHLGIPDEDIDMEVSVAQMLPFSNWFKKHINDLHQARNAEATVDLWALANGPSSLETNHYSGCMVNEVRFHTKDHESRRRTQNSGLMVEGEHKGKVMEYFGFLSSVVELIYLGDRKVLLFKCEWYDTVNRKTVKNDKHFISIDVRSRCGHEDPFVLPIMAEQVFYLDDTKMGKDWKVVQKIKHRHLWDLPDRDEVTDEGNNIRARNPMQQFESDGVVDVTQDDVDGLVHGLVRKDLPPQEMDAQKFFKITKRNKTVEVQSDWSDESEDEEILVTTTLEQDMTRENQLSYESDEGASSEDELLDLSENED